MGVYNTLPSLATAKYLVLGALLDSHTTLVTAGRGFCRRNTANEQLLANISVPLNCHTPCQCS